MHTNIESIASRYALQGETYDEMLDSKGGLRSQWIPFNNTLEQVGKQEFENRHSEIKRLLRENGVTYNIYGDPNGFNRPWKLDAIPNIIPSKDWTLIETGLKQRAHVLNLILADLYGKKELIKKGLLPIELIYNHSGFLRPCDSIVLKNKAPLTLYAADVVRNDKGGLWIMSDRTQAPSGLGYSFENRSVMSRVLPDFFKDSQVRKLSGFLNSYRNAITEISAQKTDNPKIVLLTPGPRNETYFEHAYVASFMGYTLVQGEDLVVRDGYVWLKSLSGLEKVDVIIRRVDDIFCDPLELREDSQLGVAGLLEVVRKGNVTIANPLGSGVLENPGLMSFLPNITNYFIGEELIIPSVATWWCGQKKELDFVLENINRIKIRSIYKQNGRSTVSDGNLSSKEIEILRAKIKAKPYLYVGQEQLLVATTPSFIDSELEPRYAAFRNFLVAYKGDYQCMPGGLTRSSAQKGEFKISNQLGGISKDTWVLGKEPEVQLNLSFTLPSRNNVITKQQELSSRAAENLYWVGRYAERVKSTCRFLRVVLDQINESNKISHESEQEFNEILLKSLTHFTATYPGFIDEDNKAILKDPMPEIMRIVFDPKDVGSLAHNIQALRRSIYSIRDKFSLDTWRIIYRIEEEWNTLEQNENRNIRSIRNTIDNLIIYLAALMGINMESLSRDYSYVLLDTGRRIEKTLLTTSLLRSTLVCKQEEAVEYRLMEALLLSTASLNTYRSRYRAQFSIDAVLDLLMLDINNPTSIAFQLHLISKHIDSFPPTTNNTAQGLSAEQKYITEAFMSLRIADIQEIITAEEENNVRENMSELLSKLFTLSLKSATIITEKYFSHLHTVQQSFNQASEIEEI